MADHKVDIRSGVDIECTAAAAWAIIADFSRNPEWQQGMRSCVWITEPPIALGSRYKQEAAFLGKPIRTTFEVVELVDGSSITIDTVEGTFPIKVTRTVEPLGTGDRCRVSAHVRGTPAGIMGLMSPLMAPMVKRSVDGDYKRLKGLLEN